MSTKEVTYQLSQDVDTRFDWGGDSSFEDEAPKKPAPVPLRKMSAKGAFKAKIMSLRKNPSINSKENDGNVPDGASDSAAGGSATASTGYVRLGTAPGQQPEMPSGLRAMLMESLRALGQFFVRTNTMERDIDLLIDAMIISNPRTLSDGFVVTDSSGRNEQELRSLEGFPIGQVVLSSKKTRIERRIRQSSTDASDYSAWLLLGGGRIFIEIDPRHLGVRFENADFCIRGYFTSALAAVALEFNTRRRMSMGIRIRDMTPGFEPETITVKSIDELRCNREYTVFYQDGHAKLIKIDSQGRRYQRLVRDGMSVSAGMDIVQVEFRSVANVGSIMNEDDVEGLQGAFGSPVQKAKSSRLRAVQLDSAVPNSAMLTPPLIPELHAAQNGDEDDDGWNASFSFTPLASKTMQVDPDDLALFDGSGAPPPPPAPPAPPPPPGGKSKAAVERKRVRALNWTPVPKHKLRRTFWGDSKRPSGLSLEEMTDLVDTAEMETVFALSPVKKEGSAAAPAEPASTDGKSIISLLQIQRSNNIAIYLTAVKLTPESVCQALLDCDVDALGGIDRLPSLQAILPSQEELTLVLKWVKDNSEIVDRLGKPERLFLALADVSYVQERVAFMFYRAHLPERFADAVEQVEQIELATQQVRNSDNFGQLLKLILTLGGVLNTGTYLHSSGFKIESLNRLVDTRAKDRKTTLLDYLVTLVNAKMPSVSQFVDELSNVPAAALVDVAALDVEGNSLKEIVSTFSEFAVSNSKALAALGDGDSFPKLVSDLCQTYSDKQNSLTGVAVQSRIALAIKSFVEMGLYFGEEAPSAATAQFFFKNIDKFMTNFQLALTKPSNPTPAPTPLSIKKVVPKAEEY